MPGASKSIHPSPAIRSWHFDRGGSPDRSFGSKKSTSSHFAPILFACALFSVSAAAEVKPSAIFSDHMVMQRDMPVPVWGTADPGEAVTVTVGVSACTVKVVVPLEPNQPYHQNGKL